jgi:hypothetical protein
MLRLCRTAQGTGAASRRVNDGEGPTEDALMLGGATILHVRAFRMRGA